MSKEKKPKKIESNTAEWKRLANQLARDFCPPIRPCHDCGGPVVDGYCCTRCGSVLP